MTETNVVLTPKTFTPQAHADDCVETETYDGYGLAGGGMGSYTCCVGCGAILDKTLDEEEE